MNNLRIPHQFEFIELLKKDDLGSVSKVVEKNSGKAFIFKEISPAAGTDFIRRFLREAEVLSGLSHPGIVRVESFGDISNPYIILEFFQGSTLSELIRRDSLTASDKKVIFQSLVSGIGYAHSANVIHRDIKPENILIGDDKTVKIIDFGLALRENESGKTSRGGIIGTPSYIAPEILNGETASKSTDLFALGITGLELFTGVNPFAGSDINDTINRLLSFDGTLPHELTDKLPDDYSEIIISLLSADPGKRLLPAGTDSIPVFESSRKRSPLFKDITGGNSLIKRYAPASAIILIIVFALIASSGKILSTDSGKINLSEISDKGNETADDPSGSTTQINFERPGPGINKPDNDYANPEPAKPAGSVINEEEAGFGFYNINVMPWAKVFIDGKYAETTPLKSPLKIKSGTRKLTLSHPDFGEFVTTLTVKAGSTGEYSHNFRNKSGYLAVNVFPWAEVIINDKTAGLTPFQTPLPLPAGDYRIKLINPEFNPVEKTVNVTSGDTLKFHHSFK